MTPAQALLHRYREKYRQIEASAAGLSDAYRGKKPFEIFSPDGATRGALLFWLERDDWISLAWLEAWPRGLDHGARMLAELIANCDELGVNVKTIPKGKAPALIAFYERHGFDGPHGDFWQRKVGGAR